MAWKQQQGIANKQGFFDLFANQIAYIAVDNFLNIAEIEALKNGLIKAGLQQYSYNFAVDKAPPAAHLFETHYLYEQKTPSEYFSAAAKSIAEYQNLCQLTGFDPALKMSTFLSEHLQKTVTIAEQAGQHYSHVIARELRHSALMHADFAGFIPHYWSISNVIAQYAWNIYLSDPGEGGECVVYDKLWAKEDDAHILENTYGYDEKIVANQASAVISVKPGQLVFFNSRNFHKVNASRNPRLSIGGHVGLTKDDEFILWV
jgi:hypothetical protein